MACDLATAYVYALLQVLIEIADDLYSQRAAVVVLECLDSLALKTCVVTCMCCACALWTPA
jgi:hypothetical protein